MIAPNDAGFQKYSSILKGMNSIVRCDLVLFVAIEAEEKALVRAAEELSIEVEIREGPLGSYRWLGLVGTHRVVTVRTGMGALDYRGSGAHAVHYINATQATGVISLGMAFGCYPENQKLGDVLVGTQLVPYDNRDVRMENGVVRTTYDRVRRRRAKKSLIESMRRYAARTSAHKTHFGALLSGAARIHCAAFRERLCQDVPQRGEPIVGGEMEGVGLLAASNPSTPNWLVVKGISDFGDEQRDGIIEQARDPACLAAARFVLGALALMP